MQFVVIITTVNDSVYTPSDAKHSQLDYITFNYHDETTFAFFNPISFLVKLLFHRSKLQQLGILFFVFRSHHNFGVVNLFSTRLL